MSLKTGMRTYLNEKVFNKFVTKPGLDLPADTARRLMTVEEKVDGRMMVDKFLHTKGGKALSVKNGAPLDMTPVVSGGFREGDIVLRGNSVETTAQSGMVTTITEGVRTGDWHIRKSAVSHAGIIAKNAKGELRVIQMVSGETPEDLAKLLTPRQKKLKATFLRDDSIQDFFNVKGTPITRATVMRPKDPEAAARAARRAKELLDTQVTPQGTHPWYSKFPHSLSPDGRGGVCSTFVDMAYGNAFKQPLHLPTTPLHFVIDPRMTTVGDRVVTDIKAAGSSFVEGTLQAVKR